jgi:hypothetical protein
MGQQLRYTWTLRLFRYIPRQGYRDCEQGVDPDPHLSYGLFRKCLRAKLTRDVWSRQRHELNDSGIDGVHGIPAASEGQPSSCRVRRDNFKGRRHLIETSLRPGGPERPDVIGDR